MHKIIKYPHQKLKNYFVKLISFALILLANSNFALAAVNLKINSQEMPQINLLFARTYSNDYNIDYKNPSNADHNSLQNQANKKREADKIINKIKSNLLTTNLFKITEQNNFSPITASGTQKLNQAQLSINQVPNFKEFSNKDVAMLIVFDASFNQYGDLEISTRLWDVFDEKQLFGKSYSAKSSYKKVSSLISDEIFKAATAEKIGFFDSKITYIAESGGALKRIKRVAVIDFDGENLQYLTSGKDLVLTPIFLKQRNEILFVRFFNEKPQIYSIDLQSKLLRKIGGFQETTFAPSANQRDSDIIALSIIDNGNSNIYEMNLSSNNSRKLTNTKAIDTTPSYSPDGRYITFSSDKTGVEQIYIMNNDGKDIAKLTNDKAKYSKPVWSPDGKFIAFTKMKAGQFSIGIIDIDGRNEKTITSGYLVEGAKWSPNSRYLIYSKKTGPYGKDSIPKLYLTDTLTGFERKIPTPENEGASDPDWVLN